MYLFLIPDSLQTTNRDKQEEKTTSSFYLLKALAGVICLFLLIIVIKLFKKSKSRKGKRGNGTENKSQIQLQKDIDTSYNTVSESLRTFPHYQSLNPKYDEVNEQIQIQCSESIGELNDCENKHISSKTNITDTQVNNFQKNDIVLEQNIKREDNLGAVASEKSQTSDIEERGSYIDVI